MKRKDLDEAYDEFSGFAISSPATKIRRLDAGVPPYMVDERSAVPLAIEELLPSTSGAPEVELMMDDALPSLPSVDEKALVLYKPSDAPLALNPGQSHVSLLASPDLIEGLKKAMEDEEAEARANTAPSGGESFSRWQQQLQHCVVPELRPNPSTSIMWSW